MRGERAQLTERAIQLQSSEDWRGALSVWDDILKVESNDRRALIQSGNCLIKLNMPIQAEKRFNQLLSIFKNDAQGLSGYATSLLMQDKYVDAFSILFKLKDWYPGSVIFYIRLSQVFLRLKQYELAHIFAVEGLKVHPSDSQLEKLIDQVDAAKSQIYSQDGLISVHNHDFMRDKKFISAYERGIQAARGKDYKWHWRVHVGLWAAKNASNLEGDFVECGVNHGFLSSAILNYLDWGVLGKHYYLLDTFSGIDPSYVTEEEVSDGIIGKNKYKLENGFYVDDFQGVSENFKDWENVTLIKGSVPDTLSLIDSNRIAFLHLDMNSALPESSALNKLWEKLSIGAFVLMDDFAYTGYASQYVALKAVAESLNHEILSLPTGQGLLIKTQ